jgi:hypothetical protein
VDRLIARDRSPAIGALVPAQIRDHHHDRPPSPCLTGDIPGNGDPTKDAIDPGKETGAPDAAGGRNQTSREPTTRCAGAALPISGTSRRPISRPVTACSRAVGTLLSRAALVTATTRPLKSNMAIDSAPCAAQSSQSHDGDVGE